jgi:hypothetical protein
MRLASAGRFRVNQECSVTLSDTFRDDDRSTVLRRLRRPLVTALPVALLASLALPSVSAPSATVAAGLPEPGEQRFRVYYGDMSRDLVVAEIDYRLQHDGGGYELATRGKAVGMVALFYSGVLTQNSVGRLGADGFRPERYSERRGKRPERVVRFDHARRKMIGTGEPPEVALLPGTQDRLSVFYQLGLMARGKPKQFEPGQRFTMPLASMKTIDQATFTVAGAEAVNTARGPVPALRLTVRNEDDPEDPTIDVWLGLEISMLPARIRVQEHDGKVIDQVLLPSG